MDDPNLVDVSLADKIAELTTQQKRALFFGERTVQLAYDFGLFRCGGGLEGLYNGILKLERLNSDLNHDMLNRLNTHRNDKNKILAYLFHHIDQNAPQGVMRDEMLEIIHSIGSPEEKINKFVAYMDALQPFLCQKTYSHEDAVRLIREAVTNLNKRDNYDIENSFEFSRFEKSTRQFDEKMAPVLGIKPGEPNPGRNIVVTKG